MNYSKNGFLVYFFRNLQILYNFLLKNEKLKNFIKKYIDSILASYILNIAFVLKNNQTCIWINPIVIVGFILCPKIRKNLKIFVRLYLSKISSFYKC